MFADDASTPGDGNFEINGIVDGDLSSDSKVGELPLVDVNYGFHENLQFKIRGAVCSRPEYRS